jgi:hypothetical protein
MLHSPLGIREEGDDLDDLGPLLAKYTTAAISGRYLWLLYGLGIISILAPLGYGLYRGLYARRYYGSAAVFIWSRPWLTLSVLALLIFIYLILTHGRRKRRYIALHKNGLRLSFSKGTDLKWSQIHGISVQETHNQFFTIPIGKRFRVVLYPGVGPAIKLHQDFEGLPELASRIKAAIYPRLSDELARDFQAGKWLYFGPLAVQKHFLDTGKRRIPWDSVKKIEVRQGVLTTRLEDGPILRTPVSAIPNFELLLENIRKGQPTDE